ncbi:MAG: calcium-binding protein [Rheinheimera sp.]|nr:calcium-binding protein [Rheinheimera sp.]
MQLELDVLKGTAGNDTLRGTAKDDEMFGYAGDDIVYGDAGQDKLFGGEGKDQLYGEDGDDQLFGEAGNDTLQGKAGNDWLEGGAGNDSLFGGDGSDTYVFGRGDGQDSISNDAISAGADRLLFKEGVAKEDVEYFRNGGSLVFRIKGTTDTVTVSNWFTGSAGYKLSVVEFSDGSKLDVNAITNAWPSTKAAVLSQVSNERNLSRLIDSINQFGSDDADLNGFEYVRLTSENSEVFQF